MHPDKGAEPESAERLVKKHYILIRVNLQTFYIFHIEIKPSLCHHYVMVTPLFPRRDGFPG